jgi:hypothetical protein
VVFRPPAECPRNGRSTQGSRKGSRPCPNPTRTVDHRVMSPILGSAWPHELQTCLLRGRCPLAPLSVPFRTPVVQCREPCQPGPGQRSRSWRRSGYGPDPGSFADQGIFLKRLLASHFRFASFGVLDRPIAPSRATDARWSLGSRLELTADRRWGGHRGWERRRPLAHLKGLLALPYPT